MFFKIFHMFEPILNHSFWALKILDHRGKQQKIFVSKLGLYDG